MKSFLMVGLGILCSSIAQGAADAQAMHKHSVPQHKTWLTLQQYRPLEYTFGTTTPNGLIEWGSGQKEIAGKFAVRLQLRVGGLRNSADWQEAYAVYSGPWNIKPYEPLNLILARVLVDLVTKNKGKFTAAQQHEIIETLVRYGHGDLACQVYKQAEFELLSAQLLSIVNHYNATTQIACKL